MEVKGVIYILGKFSISQKEGFPKGLRVCQNWAPTKNGKGVKKRIFSQGVLKSQNYLLGGFSHCGDQGDDFPQSVGDFLGRGCVFETFY